MNMTLRNKFFLSLLPVTVVAISLFAGCNPETGVSSAVTGNPPMKTTDAESTDRSEAGIASATSTNASAESNTEHGHKSGAHGGIMVSLGRDSYHIEAVVDSEGSIRLYTLGKDETRVSEVESQTLKGFIKADGDAESQSISFEPSPQEGDSEKMTSLFIGKLPSEFVGRKLDVTIPNIRIAGERFRLGFQSGQESHGDLPEMPDKLAASEEQDLYLTPGGRYTSADIAANGNVTATQKFKGVKSAHDMNPKEGDRICPITETKANPKFTWMIDGKPYQFCCPPCIDEFVKTAKAASDPLPEPDSFMK